MNGFMNVVRCGSGSRYVRKSSSARMYGLRLEASSCSGGYSIVKPPLPIVLSTWTMEWQETQPRPFCASGVSICSLIGLSKRPLKNTAWSWQPAHHLLPCVPLTLLHVARWTCGRTGC